jgi:uncharacterized protein YecT (DUF1311 family)
MNMNSLKVCRTSILTLIGLCFAVLVAFGQQPTKPTHSWDLLMNSSEAKEAAAKLLGHCGDAQTQDVMNACFALEFKNADQQMNSSYRSILKQLDRDDQQLVRTAQRAWLQYRICIARRSAHYKREAEALNRLKFSVAKLT